MIISFELDEHESQVTPIKVADALISSDQFDREELKELIAYLSVFTRYNENFDPNRKYNRKPDVFNMKQPEKKERLTMARPHEYWYIKRLQKYYNDNYLLYDEEVEWYANPEPNKWRFRIPSKKWEVSLTCHDKGNITDEVNQYEE